PCALASAETIFGLGACVGVAVAVCARMLGIAVVWARVVSGTHSQVPSVAPATAALIPTNRRRDKVRSPARLNLVVSEALNGPSLERVGLAPSATPARIALGASQRQRHFGSLWSRFGLVFRSFRQRRRTCGQDPANNLPFVRVTGGRPP